MKVKVGLVVSSLMLVALPISVSAGFFGSKLSAFRSTWARVVKCNPFTAYQTWMGNRRHSATRALMMVGLGIGGGVSHAMPNREAHVPLSDKHNLQLWSDKGSTTKYTIERDKESSFKHGKCLRKAGGRCEGWQYNILVRDLSGGGVVAVMPDAPISTETIQSNALSLKDGLTVNDLITDLEIYAAGREETKHDADYWKRVRCLRNMAGKNLVFGSIYSFWPSSLRDERNNSLSVNEQRSEYEKRRQARLEDLAVVENLRY